MILGVADTSPIRYLLLIGAIDILPQLFDRVILPDHVAKVELQDPMTPQIVQSWAAHLPTWIEVRKPLNPEEMDLHRGESEAIALAKELKAFAVLLDDADA